MLNFCLDLGGTGTRGALFDQNGEQLARRSCGAGALSLGVDVAEAAVRDVWRQVCNTSKVKALPNETKIWIGAAGKGLPGRAKDLQTKLAEFSYVSVFSDGYAALLGATNAEPGALIAVGTGIAAVRLDQKGGVTALSGWGFPAGDLGSGAWIGLEFYRAALKQLDGIELRYSISDEALVALLNTCGPNVNDLMKWHVTAKPRDFASLAPLVVAGAQAKDPFCQNLLERAASEIMQVASVLQVTGYPVHISGGLGSTLLPYLVRTTSQIDWQASTAKCIDGLHLIAQGCAPAEHLLTRPGLEKIKQVQ